MLRRAFPFVLLLAASAAAAQSQRLDEADRYVDKYARTFTLEGESQEICREEADALIADLAAKGKTREEAAASVRAMTQTMEANRPQWYPGMWMNAEAARTPSSTFRICILKVSILKDQNAGTNGEWLPAYGQKDIPPAAAGLFRRTGGNTWRYVSSLDNSKGLSDYSLAYVQRNVRAKAGREFPVPEAIAACQSELEAAERATLKLADEELARNASSKAQQNQVRSLREEGRYSRFSVFYPSTIAYNGLWTPADARSSLAHWEEGQKDPSEDKRALAAANACLMKFCITQCGRKPAAKK